MHLPSFLLWTMKSDLHQKVLRHAGDTNAVARAYITRCLVCTAVGSDNSRGERGSGEGRRGCEQAPGDRAAPGGGNERWVSFTAEDALSRCWAGVLGEVRRTVI